MKTATIVLMSIGLFVLIKNSLAADPDEVFNMLATKNDKSFPGKPESIHWEKLADYLIQQGWTRPDGSFNKFNPALHVGDWEGFINKKKWNAMIKIATWLREGSNVSADVWKQLSSNGESTTTDKLAKYMNANNWNNSTQGMDAVEAAKQMPWKGNIILKPVWYATIQVEAFIRNAK